MIYNRKSPTISAILTLPRANVLSEEASTPPSDQNDFPTFSGEFPSEHTTLEPPLYWVSPEVQENNFSKLHPKEPLPVRPSVFYAEDWGNVLLLCPTLSAVALLEQLTRVGYSISVEYASLIHFTDAFSDVTGGWRNVSLMDADSRNVPCNWRAATLAEVLSAIVQLPRFPWLWDKDETLLLTGEGTGLLGATGRSKTNFTVSLTFTADHSGQTRGNLAFSLIRGRQSGQLSMYVKN